MSRKKRHEEHENHERWLVSYADFITLLFAFFTVLYATAQTDQSKLEAVIDGMTAAFQGGMPLAVLDVMSLKTGSELEAEHVSLSANSQPEIENLRMQLAGSLSDSVVQMGLVDQRLTLVLPERMLFAAGSADVQPAAFATLAELAAVLSPTRAKVEVVGHADAAPVRGGPFADNWGLASARGVNVVRYLERHGMPTARLAASSDVSPGLDAEARAVTFRVVMAEAGDAREVAHAVEARAVEAARASEPEAGPRDQQE
jgi:chemotaxis protein MotB